MVGASQSCRAGDGCGGFFWQNTGSSKSFSMEFLAEKVLRKVAGDAIGWSLWLAQTPATWHL